MGSKLCDSLKFGLVDFQEIVLNCVSCLLVPIVWFQCFGWPWTQWTVLLELQCKQKNDLGRTCQSFHWLFSLNPFNRVSQWYVVKPKEDHRSNWSRVVFFQLTRYVCTHSEQSGVFLVHPLRLHTFRFTSNICYFGFYYFTASLLTSWYKNGTFWRRESSTLTLSG